MSKTSKKGILILIIILIMAVAFISLKLSKESKAKNNSIVSITEGATPLAQTVDDNNVIEVKTPLKKGASVENVATPPVIDEGGKNEDIPEEIKISNEEATRKVVESLIARYNACETINEKRELLNSNGAVGNDQLRNKQNEDMGGKALGMDKEILSSTKNLTQATDLYLQTYYIIRNDKIENYLLYTSKNDNNTGSNIWATNLVCFNNSWYEYESYHKYNGSLESTSMTQFSNKTEEEILNILSGEKWLKVEKAQPLQENEPIEATTMEGNEALEDEVENVINAQQEQEPETACENEVLEIVEEN